MRGLLAVAPAYYGELASFSLDPSVAGVAAALCVVMGLGISLPPLAECLRLNLRDTLHEEGRSGTMSRRSVWMRQALIGAETAACAVLLVGALLLLRTFVNLMNVPTGFDPSGVVTARMSVQGPRYDDGEQVIRFFEDGVARLERMPSIQGAAVGASLPAERALNLPATLPDTAEPNDVRIVNWRYVTPGYFNLLKIRHLAGRALTATDRAGAPAVAVVNETFARQMYGGTPQALGRRVIVSRQAPREIVGVVADTIGWTLADTPRPMLFVPLAQVEPALLRIAHSFFPPRWIVRSAQDVDGARRVLQQVVSELDPSQPFIEVRSVESLMVNSVSTQRFYLVVLAAFALFAVLSRRGRHLRDLLVRGREPDDGNRCAAGAWRFTVEHSVGHRRASVGAGRGGDDGGAGSGSGTRESAEGGALQRRRDRSAHLPRRGRRVDGDGHRRDAGSGPSGRTRSIRWWQFAGNCDGLGRITAG